MMHCVRKSICDSPLRLQTEFFRNELEIVQYNAILVNAGAIKGASCDRIYRDLGLEPFAE